MRAAPRRLVRERIGALLGWLAAPVFGAVSRARSARTFHPDGQVFTAMVEPLAREGALGRVAALLRGPALVRLSSALWKHGHERLDALGLALRLREGDAPSSAPSAGDQDLLFATIRSPFTMPLAPFATNVHDYLANAYFAVAPFDVPALGRAKWKLVPLDHGAPEGSRETRLARAVEEGRARFVLLARRTWRRRWQPVATVTLRERAHVDQEALRFSPFRTGRGIVPRGLVHALRRGAYAVSQAARPRTAADRRDVSRA